LLETGSLAAWNRVNEQNNGEHDSCLEKIFNSL